jgi:hypothetical protein
MGGKFFAQGRKYGGLDRWMMVYIWEIGNCIFSSKHLPQQTKKFCSFINSIVEFL